jgi:hypothetical protein
MVERHDGVTPLTRARSRVSHKDTRNVTPAPPASQKSLVAEKNGSNRLLTPAELADFLAVERDYVYAHAEELGAIRLGGGPRARLRFDLEEVRRRLAAPPCLGSRGSSELDPAPAKGLTPRGRRRMGTNVELLPIKGQREAAA